LEKPGEHDWETDTAGAAASRHDTHSKRAPPFEVVAHDRESWLGAEPYYQTE